MQTQTPEEAKRFFVRFVSICGIVVSLIAAGLFYIQYAIVSTYFPGNPQVWATIVLLALLATALWLTLAAITGRWLPIGKTKESVD